MAHKRKPPRAEREGPPASPEALVGEVLAQNYRLIQIIGSGGHATIFEARRVKPALKVAVKVLNPNPADDSIVERFRQEVRIARMLKGLNQVAFLDEGEVPGGQPYWVMEFLDGEDLSARLARRHRLEPAEAITLAEGMGEALGEAHELGIVHRDIKPANVFLARGPNGSELVKVLDFGAARVQHSDSNLTQTGQIIGTPWYMSPEQARGQPLDLRSDQFSLAILMFQILTGEVPFNAPQPTDVLFKLTGDPHPPLTSLEPSLPDEIEAVFDRALSKAAEARFPTVREFVASLRIALSIKPRRRSTVVIQRDGIEPPRPIAETPSDELARTLIAQGVLDAEPLAKALASAQESGGELADAIVQLGLLEEEPLLQAAAGRGGRYHLAKKVRLAAPKPEALARVTLEVASRLRIAPLGWSELISELRVYSATPAVRDLEGQLRSAKGAERVSVILALPSAVSELLRKSYPPSPPPEPASNLLEASPTPTALSIPPPPGATLAGDSPASTVQPDLDTNERSVSRKVAEDPHQPADLDHAERRFPAVEYVPGPGRHPAVERMENHLSQRAAARAADALGANYTAVVLEHGVTQFHLERAPPPPSLVGLLQAGTLPSSEVLDGWGARRAPIAVAGRLIGTLFALFEPELRPDQLQDDLSVQAVADQVARALDLGASTQRQSRDLVGWLEGRRLLFPLESWRAPGQASGESFLRAPVLTVDLRPLIAARAEPQARLALLRHSTSKVAAMVFAFGGRTSIGGDGLVGVWGSTEPGPCDTRRAIEAGMAIATQLGSAGPIHLGVVHGEVFLGSALAGSTPVSLLAGMAVSQAWRLGGARAGKVVTDRATLNRVGGSLEARPEPIAELDGVFTLEPKGVAP